MILTEILSLSFGQRRSDFRGFQMPTGIFCRDGFVYVADSKYADISVFDYSGELCRQYWRRRAAGRRRESLR